MNQDYERARRRDSDGNYGRNCEEQVRSRNIFIVFHHLVLSNATPSLNPLRLDVKSLSPALIEDFDGYVAVMTRCDQTTPEPDSPYKAVILHGGRGLGFSQIMPAFGDLLSDDQIDDVIAYLRTFCKNDRRL